MRADLLALEAMLAYDIDFPEEDDGPVPRSRIERTAERTLVDMRLLLATGERAALLQEGALVVLAGPPNAGKSSLFNALLGETRAIVTEIPGTTRDAIEAVLDVPGWPIRLVDTAGLRETNERIEQMGIETTNRYLRNAAVVVYCVDIEAEISSSPEADAERTVVVRTKRDLVATNYQFDGDIAVSAETGSGLRELVVEIEKRLSEQQGVVDVDAPMLTKARHAAALATAASKVEQFLSLWRNASLPGAIAATHVREAVNALSGLIGRVDTEDILDVVFRSFCVGK